MKKVTKPLRLPEPLHQKYKELSASKQMGLEAFIAKIPETYADSYGY